MHKPSITLASLSLQIIDKSSLDRRSTINLSNFGNHLDFLDICEKILSPLKKTPTSVTTLGDLFQITVLKKDERYLRGIFESGRTGSEQDILSAETKSRSYRMTKHDAMMIPYYFCIYLPENERKGIIFLQRYKQSGVQGLFLEFLFKEFKSQYKPFELENNYITNTNSLNKMLDESAIKELRLTQTGWSSDRADNELRGAEEKPGTLVVTYKPSYNNYLDIGSKIKSVLTGKLDADKIVEFDFIQPDEVSFLLKRNGKNRRITFTEQGTDFRPYLDVTEQVKLENGYPTFESIDSIAIELLRELSTELYESPNNQN